MNIEEIKTVKSYFTCLLWVVLEPFQVFFLSSKKTPQNRFKTTQKLRRDDNKQLKYDSSVLFSSIFIFNLWEWVTCGHKKLYLHDLAVIKTEAEQIKYAVFYLYFLSTPSPWVASRVLQRKWSTHHFIQLSITINRSVNQSINLYLPQE